MQHHNTYFISLEEQGTSHTDQIIHAKLQQLKMEVFISFYINLNSRKCCLSKPAKPSRYYHQVANSDLCLHFSGTIFQLAEPTWCSHVPMKRDTFSEQCSGKVLTEMYAKTALGRKAFCQQKWKQWVIETDQAHEVPWCEMNSFSSLFLCAKALSWMAEHRLSPRVNKNCPHNIERIIQLLCIHYFSNYYILSMVFRKENCE